MSVEINDAIEELQKLITKFQDKVKEQKALLEKIYNEEREAHDSMTYTNLERSARTDEMSRAIDSMEDAMKTMDELIEFKVEIELPDISSEVWSIVYGISDARWTEHKKKRA